MAEFKQHSWRWTECYTKAVEHSLVCSLQQVNSHVYQLLAARNPLAYCALARNRG